MPLIYGNTRIGWEILNTAASVVFDTDSFWQRTTSTTATTLYQEFVKRVRPVGGWAGFSLCDLDGDAITGGMANFHDDSNAVSGMSSTTLNGWDATRPSGMPAGSTIGFTREIKFTGAALGGNLICVRNYITNIASIFPTFGNVFTGQQLKLRLCTQREPAGLSNVPISFFGGPAANQIAAGTVTTLDGTATSGTLQFTDVTTSGNVTLADTDLIGLDLGTFNSGTTPAAANAVLTYNGAQIIIPSVSAGLRTAIIGSSGNTCTRSLTYTQKDTDAWLVGHDCTHVIITMARNDVDAVGLTTFLANLTSLMALYNSPGTRKFVLWAPHTNTSDGDTTMKLIRDGLVGFVANRADCLLISGYDGLVTSPDIAAYLDDGLHENFSGAKILANSFCTGLEQASADYVAYAASLIANAAPVTIAPGGTVPLTITFKYGPAGAQVPTDFNAISYALTKNGVPVGSPTITTSHTAGTGFYAADAATTGFVTGDSGTLTGTGTYSGVSYTKSVNFVVGSAVPSASDNATAAAAAILVTPANKIATNASNQVTASNGGGGGGTTGDGDTPVNHNTNSAGGVTADAMRLTTSTGAGIPNVKIFAFLQSDYDAGIFTRQGQTTTTADGRWFAPLMLNSGQTYVIVFSKSGDFNGATAVVTLP